MQVFEWPAVYSKNALQQKHDLELICFLYRSYLTEQQMPPKLNTPVVKNCSFMRHIRYCQLCIIITTSLLFCLPASGCQINARGLDAPPFSAQDKQGHWSGMDMDYIHALLSAAGCQYHFIKLPWGRSLQLLAQGELDLMVNVTKTPEREKNFHFVGPQRLETMRLTTLKGRFKPIKNWQQMAKLEATLMRQRGTYLGSQFDQVLKQNQLLKNQLINIANVQARIGLVLKNRADGYLADEIYIAYQFKTNPEYAALEIHPLVIHQNPVYYAFSKASMSDENMTKIRAAFTKIAKSGVLQEIGARYLQMPAQ